MEKLDKEYILLAKWSEEKQQWIVKTLDNAVIGEYDGSIDDKTVVENFAPNAWREKTGEMSIVPDIYYSTGLIGTIDQAVS